MNNINLIGRITHDLDIKEVKTSDRDFKVLNFSLAVRDTNDKTDFINCHAYNKTAELINRYCRKGYLLGVSGKLKTKAYLKDNQKLYSTQVLIETITLLNNNKADSKEPTTDHKLQEFDNLEQINISSDDLPF